MTATATIKEHRRGLPVADDADARRVDLLELVDDKGVAIPNSATEQRIGRDIYWDKGRGTSAPTRGSRRAKARR